MQKSITKRKRIGVESSSSGGTRSQDNTSEGRDGLERKRRKRSTSPNTDPVSVLFMVKLKQVNGTSVLEIKIHPGPSWTTKPLNLVGRINPWLPIGKLPCA